MPDPVILVHGAWQGSWVWRDFQPFLHEVGIETHAIDLPGNGVDDTPFEQVDIDCYVEHVGRLIDKIGQPVSIIGHSGGGVVATAVAEAFADQVKRVAYIAGMMLPAGMTFGDLLEQENAAERGLLGVGPYLQWSKDRTVSRVPPEVAVWIFLNDVTYRDALEGAQNLTPQPEGGRSIAANWTADRFGKLPRLYVECSRDRSVLPEIQQRMRQLVPGARCVSLDVGHAPHISAPAKLARALIPFLTQ